MKGLAKRVFCIVAAAAMVVMFAPLSGRSEGETTVAVWIQGMLPNGELVVSTRSILKDVSVHGVLRPIDTPRPAGGTLPADAVPFEKLDGTPFYDLWGGHSTQEYHKADFNAKLNVPDGSYVLYATCDGGASWYPFYDTAVCGLWIQGGEIITMSAHSYGTGHDMTPDWNELIQSVTADIKDKVITVEALSGYLIYNTPMTYTLVDEFSSTTVATATASYGDVKAHSYYGRSFSASFDLPAEEGFYKIYFTLGGLDFQASKAFWVREDGRLSVIELNSINAPPLYGHELDSDYRVEPLSITGPDGNAVSFSYDYLSSAEYKYPPFINLLDTYEDYLYSIGDTIVAYSLNGGNTWTTSKVQISSKQVSQDMLKYLKKHAECQLVLKASKSSFPDEFYPCVITYPAVKAPPAAPKLKVNYRALYLSPNSSIPSFDKLSQQTFWALTKPNTDEIVREGIQIAPMAVAYASDPPTTWFEMPESGVAVKPLYVTTTAKNGKISYRAKKQSALYAVRMGAVAHSDGSYSLPSKWVKITAGGLEVPKTVKADYKKETVKPPKDTEYNMRNKKGRGNGKTTVSLEDEASTTWSYRAMPSQKKAASATVSHHIAPRAEFDPGTTKIENGKLVADKKLEFSVNGGKWGKFKAPKGPQAAEILVRVKPSGKQKVTMAYSGVQSQSATLHDAPAAAGTDGLAQAGQWVPEQAVLLSSREQKFTYEWGETASGKPGILSFTFTPLD